jgi:hypothetical protein
MNAPDARVAQRRNVAAPVRPAYDPEEVSRVD